MSLQEQFDKAADDAKNVVPESIPSADKLILYGLYKQATIGDNETAKPGILNVTGRSKWNAWNDHKGKDKETAMKEYIAKVEELKAAYCT